MLYSKDTSYINLDDQIRRFFSRVYLLDTNIVLTIWKKGLDILQKIETCPFLDFKVTNDCIIELSKKASWEEFWYDPKFILINNHLVSNHVYTGDMDRKENRLITTINGETRYIVGNKVSGTDLSLVYMCQTYSYFTLVTNDKKLLANAKRVLYPTRFLTYEQFRIELLKIGII